MSNGKPKQLAKKEARLFLKRVRKKWFWNKTIGAGDIQCFCGTMFSNPWNGKVLVHRNGFDDMPVPNPNKMLDLYFWEGKWLIRHDDWIGYELKENGGAYKYKGMTFIDCPFCEQTHSIGYWRTCEPLVYKIRERLVRDFAGIKYFLTKLRYEMSGERLCGNCCFRNENGICVVSKNRDYVHASAIGKNCENHLFRSKKEKKNGR